MILVYITCKDKKEAKKIAEALLNNRLIACANFSPIESMYRWKGKLVNDKEYVLLAKTENKHYKTIKKLVTNIHSYDIPCITKIKAKENKKYENWIKGEIR